MKSHSSRFHHSLLQYLLRLQQARKEEGGYSLVVTVAMLLILSTLLISAAVVSKVDSASTSASARSSNGFFAAEAGLNLRANQIREQFQGFIRPDGTTPQDTNNDGEIWDNCAAGDGSGDGDFDCISYTFQGQDVFTYVEELGADENLDGIPDDSDGDGVPDPISITIPTGERFGGLSAQEFRYDLWSVARSGDFPSAMLGMSFKSRVIPLFQFAVFYENDADFTIPPNMTINGRVHSNGDLYLNSAGSDYRLTINGDVTTAGTLFRGNKDRRPGQQCAGNVTIRRQNGSPQDLLCGTGITRYLDDTTTPSDISTWGTAIDTQIPRLEVPSPEVYNPTPGSTYWDAADLRIVLEVDSNGNPTDRNGNGYVIEVRNQNGSVDTNLSDDLINSCPVTNTVVEDRLNFWSGIDDIQGLPGNDEVLPLSEYQPVYRRVSVDSTAGLAVGDILTIGNDIDSNVIDGIFSSGGQPYVRLRRRLGHSYQSTPIVSTGDSLRKAVVSTSDTFFNYREKHGASGGDEGQFIRMINVDVQALLDCAHAQSLMGSKQLDDRTEGGLVWFFTVDSPNPKPNLSDDPDTDGDNNSQVGSTFGVRLYNGASLNSTIAGAPTIEGLTIISDEAIYVRGDYNLHTSANPSTDTWRPAAFMADTINVLSNAAQLDDSDQRAFSNNLPDASSSGKVDFDAGSRRASETTINAAFLSGSEITGGANGAATQLNNIESGGVNNFPRFHEHWSDRNLNYLGSLVSLNEPRRVNSDFCGSYDADNCNIYSPPVRNWDYEQRFNDAGNLPPLTPRTVYLRQELFQRDFDRTSSKTTNWFASIPNIPSIQPNFSL